MIHWFEHIHQCYCESKLNKIRCKLSGIETRLQFYRSAYDGQKVSNGTFKLVADLESEKAGLQTRISQLEKEIS
jgi:hypothetical protein